MLFVGSHYRWVTGGGIVIRESLLISRQLPIPAHHKQGTTIKILEWHHPSTILLDGSREGVDNTDLLPLLLGGVVCSEPVVVAGGMAAAAAEEKRVVVDDCCTIVGHTGVRYTTEYMLAPASVFQVEEVGDARESRLLSASVQGRHIFLPARP